MTATLQRAAAGQAEMAQQLVGELSTDPWEEKQYDKHDALWQAAAQRRHLHKRRANQSLGVCSVDLSGPHEGTPQPGSRVGSSLAHYFLVITVKFAEEVDGEQPAGGQNHDVQHGGSDARVPDSERKVAPHFVDPFAAGSDAPAPDSQQESWKKPILYAAIMEKKSDTPSKLQRLLAQIRSEHGTMPSKLVYRVHSDCGLEFLNEALDEYLRFHGILHTTTQGYDPSANGAAENVVGM